MTKRLLLVDDEKNIRLTVRRSLSGVDLEIVEAPSGEEALERLALIDFDLMLLDLRLPGISGMELLDRMRELGISVKTVVISAHGTIDLAVRLLKEGVLDFIEKPFSPDEIRDIVGKYL